MGHYQKTHLFSRDDIPVLVLRKFFSNLAMNHDLCIEWNGTKNNKGYGQLPYRGYPFLVHRLSYFMFKGNLPPFPERELDHLCRNRQCVNPYHLEIVTRKENQLRGMSPWAMNSRKTHCVKGHSLMGSSNVYFRKDRRGRECKKCRTQNMLMRRKRNPKFTRQQRHAYYLRHREEILERNRQWKIRHLLLK